MNPKFSLFKRALVGGASMLFLVAGCGGSSSQQAGAGNGSGGDGVGSGGTPAAGSPSTGATGATGGSNSGTPAPTAAPHSTHAHCGWIGADTAEQGVASFQANPDFFDAIHPKWFTLNPDGSPRTIAFTDDQRVVSTAQAHQVKLIPLIDSDSVDYLRTILSSPSNITAHAQALAALVQQHNYDGIELDYEHLWSAADRAPYVSLVTQTAALLHSAGKVLTLALPAIDQDNGQSAYDYAALNAQVDVMHLMAYDYHFLGGDHLGPLAPEGWVDAVTARAGTTGVPSKYVLGVANYAIGPGWYGSVPDAIAKCGGTYATTTDHMNVCPYGVRTPGRAPNCASTANLWFEDSGSVTEKVASAKKNGLGGIGYWTVGSEPPGFFDAIKSGY
jgi:hypothetical protein